MIKKTTFLILIFSAVILQSNSQNKEENINPFAIILIILVAAYKFSTKEKGSNSMQNLWSSILILL
jgi:hypothetical protein